MSTELRINLHDGLAESIETLCKRMGMDPVEFCVYLICEGTTAHAGVTAPAMICDLAAVERLVREHRAAQAKAAELENKLQSNYRVRPRYSGGANQFY